MKQRFFRKILKNGMTVILEKRDLPMVSVGFAVRQGGVNESSDEKGISHFIEHMLYKGTTNRNREQIAAEIERNGGVLNGLTDETLTMYYCKMPSERLKIALDVLSDLVKNPKFDSKEIEKERQVIFEEMKMYKDSPIRYVHDKIQSFLYEEPFGLDLIGTEETMNSIDREKMVETFKRIYTPKNMILCVVGDADFEGLIKFAEENFEDSFGEIKKQEIKKKNNSKIETREGIDQANLVFAFHTPLVEDKTHYASQVLATVLGGGMSSRLWIEIREKRNLAYGVRAGMTSHKDFSYLYIYVGTKKENVEDVKNLILQELKKISEELGEKEFNEVKEQMIGQFKISMEDSAEQLLKLITCEVDGDVEKFYEFEKSVRDVKLEDVKNLAKIKDYSFFALIPE